MNKIVGLVISLLLMCGIYSNAQQVDTLSLESAESAYIDDELDSLVNLWYVQTKVTLVPDTIYSDPSSYTNLPDSVFIERLENLISPIQFVYNDKVRAFIEMYTNRKREQVEIMLGLSEYYFPIFEEALDKYNIPHELKYLSIIESALNPRAFSRAGASGLWQFMLGTGKMYGLRCDSYVDERRDPVKASYAAARYLNDLYTIYGDWYLAIAAYNCGPGNVNKAIARTGGKKDFWAIYYRLPKETRGYVPAFIAAAYTMNYYPEHNLMPRPNVLPNVTDTVMISKPLHFSQIVAVTGISMDQLRDLNPQYKRDVIPAQGKQLSLKLPIEKTCQFVGQEASIYNYNREQLFGNGQMVISPSDERFPASVPYGKVALYYTVKQGDVPGGIAEKFNVRVNDLKDWNNLRRNMIRIGQKLVVYVPKSKVDYYKSVSNGDIEVKEEPAAVKETVATIDDGEFLYYTVRSGDNLWTIAQKFPGTTNTEIMKLNNISNSRKIAIGQKLKIKKKG